MLLDKVGKAIKMGMPRRIKKLKEKGDIDGLIKEFNKMTSVLRDRKIDIWPRRVAAAEYFRRISNEADETLMKIVRDQVVEPLIQTLDGIEELPYGSKMMFLTPICQTMENIGDSRVIEPLRKLSKALKDDEDHQIMVNRTIEKIKKHKPSQ